MNHHKECHTWHGNHGNNKLRPQTKVTSRNCAVRSLTLPSTHALCVFSGDNSRVVSLMSE